ncbi:peptidoglycan-binding protein [Alkalihalobacterium elongatum]|uniref:peptidoglycan-binding protein n=1 Tax=Alkalihalobacterium elongatum TaxID=2675466 RepID=UPI001C1F5E33|nr:peptidoglycan-binding protein [Alkalihalobacterium elongatum]
MIVKRFLSLLMCLLLIVPVSSFSVMANDSVHAEEIEKEKTIFIEELKEESITLRILSELVIEGVLFYLEDELIDSVEYVEEGKYEIEGITTEDLPNLVIVFLDEGGLAIATIEGLEVIIFHEQDDEQNEIIEEVVEGDQDVEQDLTEKEATSEKIEETTFFLQYGDQKPEVRELKEYLHTLGYFTSDQPLEYYGQTTRNQVEQFQRDIALQITGAVDEETWLLLEGLATGDLRQGMYRDDVVDLKILLYRNGLSVSSNPTTYFGPITARQLQTFQEQQGLEVTGVASSETLQALEAASENNLWNGVYDERVIYLKLMLAKTGHSVSSNPTDFFGPITERQVKAFQKDYGLAATGVVTNDVWEKLIDVTALKQGMSHRDVVQLKMDLAILGYSVSSNPTTFYGTITASMVSEFQRDYGLEVTGVSDIITVTLLNELASGPLREGMYRDDVVNLKINLEKVGFKVSNNPTNYFGSITTSTLISFQETFGLKADGIADSETVNLLAELANGSLYLGLNNSKVREMKIHLAVLGYDVSDRPTGLYGSITERMVSEFQSDFNLPVTGAADSRTLKLLRERATGPLQEGMYRDDVVILKIMLAEAGFRVSNRNTNYFGPITTTRVKEFQASKNLSQTGIVDNTTLNELRNASGILYNGLRHRDVIELKLNLERAGFKVSNNPTNYFGPSTELRVKAFQKRYGLSETGIVDKATKRMLERVVNNEVARSVSSIVDGSKNYSYRQLQRDINTLEFFYPGLIETRVIGKSVDGRNLYAIKLGTGSKEVFFNGSNHAREHMTTNVLMKMVDEYARAYAGHYNIGSYNVRSILNDVSIWFVPMVNPDGVMLVQQGASTAKNPSQVIAINGGSTNFSSWKANIRGVDLNRQFPALWDTITGNPGRPSPSNYKGTRPLSEPEAKALYDFTLSRNFLTAISYHSSGEVIYTRYNQEPYSQRIARGVSNITGYSPINLQHSASGGGFTDWFILSQKKPALTPEISPFVGPRPVPLSNWSRIWTQNRTVGLYIADEARKR